MVVGYELTEWFAKLQAKLCKVPCCLAWRCSTFSTFCRPALPLGGVGNATLWVRDPAGACKQLSN
jgi:hypothetical protein